MAKYNDEDFKLKDNQKVYFGDNEEGSIHFDGTKLVIGSDTDVDINISPGTDIVLDYAAFPDTDGDSEDELLTDGAGQLYWGATPVTIGGDRGVTGGGYLEGATSSNVLEYISISVVGNAVDFGDLSIDKYAIGSTSNGNTGRGVWGGGHSLSTSTTYNVIDYITIAITGNSTDFGDLTEERRYISAASNGSNDRGIWTGGTEGGGSRRNIIDYSAISTLGNATDFGDMVSARTNMGALSNSTNERGVIVGGQTSSKTNIIEYVTINSAGNSTDFGDLLTVLTAMGACSNGTDDRGIIGGGAVTTDVIQYITISTPSNATDFGNLLVARTSLQGATDSQENNRGIFLGGYSGSARDNVIQYITISTLGNATDFGDLTQTKGEMGACSNVGAITGTGVGDIGVFGGGSSSTGAEINDISYIAISTTSNSVDFGNLTDGRRELAACSNGYTSRGVFAGGYSLTNIIDYITITSTGNATNFGDLTLARRSQPAGASNGTNDRGVFMGGYNSPAENIIDYISISSTGNAINFGDLLTATYLNTGTSNGTNDRAVKMGGNTGSVYTNIIEYITISSTGNATDFGDLLDIVGRNAGTSNGTNNRGVCALGIENGVNYVNVIEYITISSTGNSTNFGDLTVGRRAVGACSNTTNDRGIIGGGDTGTYSNVIDYITISSTGDATDFGDLTVAKWGLAGCSNA